MTKKAKTGIDAGERVAGGAMVRENESRGPMRSDETDLEQAGKRIELMP